MTTVLNGVLGGAMVGLVAAIITRIASGRASPLTPVLARFGADATAPPWFGVVTSVLYGAVGGGLLLALELSVLGALGVPPSLVAALAVSGTWAAVLLLVASVGGYAADHGSLDRATVLALATYHVTYGLGLGLWIRLTWIT